MKIFELKTQRLLLRQWKETDLHYFSDINSDPDVMEYYPSVLSKKESDAFADKIIALIEKNGWGFWAIENLFDNKFIGFVGLHKPDYELPVSPCIEIGWRLAKSSWGNGYATEAGHAAVKLAFEVLKLNEIYSFTSISNERSQAVMRRLQFSNTNNNFSHPMLPAESTLSQHVLYRLTKEQWDKIEN